ncbi:hypothetical protein EI94DRAFT_1834480 [Lactarius quietus]|nr:hypothetical protein EI94DRAFT_1834480 [Lactarius quietus]
MSRHQYGYEAPVPPGEWASYLASLGQAGLESAERATVRWLVFNRSGDLVQSEWLGSLSLGRQGHAAISRSIAPDGGGLRLWATLRRVGLPNVVSRAALVRVESSLAPLFCQVLLSVILATVTAIAIERNAGYAAKMSAPAQVHLQGPQDEPMDIDPAPTHSPPSSSSAPRGLPLPGRFVNGAHEVVHHEM